MTDQPTPAVHRAAIAAGRIEDLAAMLTDTDVPAALLAAHADDLDGVAAILTRVAADVADRMADAECARCECSGRITVHVDDDHGGYDGSAPCPDCRPVTRP